MTTRDPVLNPPVLERRTSICRAFQSAEPLPAFAVVGDFLCESRLADALAGCRSAELATFCGYSPTGEERDLRNEFREPEEGPVYVTIHERPVRPVPQLLALGESMTAPETLQALQEMTGIELAEQGHRGVLTCWGPWSFLGPHTDAGPQTRPNRLIISLSLTQGWDSRHGGHTGFAWGGVPPLISLPPRLNTAILFAPHAGSFHWVEQIAGDAPPRVRFTWTMEYI
jgi:hypothetical protein